ncbi:MAG TPA: hypothetical protein VHP58_05710 [Alphaproteobacteria bacterium]|nr:hypothetical protein [Alphaproteobacteria bacterium]
MQSETFDTIARKMTEAELMPTAEAFFELSFSAEDLASNLRVPSQCLSMKRFAADMFVRGQLLNEKSPPLAPAMAAA